MLKLHTDLTKPAATSIVVSAVIGIAGVLLLSSQALAPGSLDAPAWLVVLSGLACLAVAYLGMAWAPRWYRRATWVVRNTTASPASLQLRFEQDGDSSKLYAELQGTELDLADSAVLLLIPRWDFRHWLGCSLSARVFVDPASLEVVAIDIEAGRLWAMPHN